MTNVSCQFCNQTKDRKTLNQKNQKPTKKTKTVASTVCVCVCVVHLCVPNKKRAKDGQIIIINTLAPSRALHYKWAKNTTRNWLQIHLYLIDTLACGLPKCSHIVISILNLFAHIKYEKQATILIWKLLFASRSPAPKLNKKRHKTYFSSKFLRF